MFKFDEAAINEQFGRMLDIMNPHIASRSADFPVLGQFTLLRLPGLKLLPLLGYEEDELGLKVIFGYELLRRGGEDVIKLTAQQLVDAMVRGIIKLRHSIGCRLTVGPLMFEYGEGLVSAVEEQLPIYGVEVVVVTLVEWGFMR